MKMTINNEFQPILISWFTPDILHIETKVVCRNQSQLDFFREMLNVPHYEQRIYTLNETTIDKIRKVVEDDNIN